MNIDLQKMNMKRIKASWFNPRDGLFTDIGTFKAEGIMTFDPPSEKTPGNDWVLVLDRN
jgi:hypothetical protein